MREDYCTCDVCGLEQQAELPAQCCNCKAWMYYPDNYGDDDAAVEETDDDDIPY